ncbi:6-O-methylguanine DNA methyltransferase [Cercophora newfieldiana]|uniref:Methylated-DNA--protein-cysteine methyltransferase n=1 Tax=Cercophora newfieldiana TaxID=92897 RepID=A0AA39YHG8_9PEZI|nr:6-O-methylguanine DNA methyltransferase [Cercophora newfieldiana]
MTSRSDRRNFVLVPTITTPLTQRSLVYLTATKSPPDTQIAKTPNNQRALPRRFSQPPTMAASTAMSPPVSPTTIPPKPPLKSRDPASIILTSNLSPYQKSVLLLLCQVPPGSFTTYGILATYLRSSPRAVGNALRNNPFAPTVPCHRVVATGGLLGGFKGKVGRRDGDSCLTLQEKRSLLRKEGVRFDGKGTGRVVGTPFTAFR